MKRKLLLMVLTSLQICAFAGSEPDEGYVAHEWGTFTSVQGADGTPLVWHPLVTTELPSFVYDISRPRSGDPGSGLALLLGGKESLATLQRMETPVIYFYSARQRTVDVDVRFPQGLITEWYPQAAPLTLTEVIQGRQGRGSRVRWPQVEVLPRGAHTGLKARLPGEARGHHYFAARLAEADFVRTTSGPNDQPHQELEQFLFYRGVGSFTAPLEISMGGDEANLNLANRGDEALKHLFVLQIRNGQGHFSRLSELAANGNTTVNLTPSEHRMPWSGLCEALRTAMRQALIDEGLFALEAEAMVATWKESWFEEEGLRVLYVLSRPWTDRTLPLTLEPEPKELVRVMVGRGELITPTMERNLTRQIVRYAEADQTARPRVIAETRDLGLGRFLEPAVRLVTDGQSDEEFHRAAWELLRAAGQPAAPSPSLARK